MKKLLILGFGLLLAATAIGQDIHFSQFYHSPLTMNPANTGVFDGDFRAGLNYRNQWRSTISKPFKTGSIFYDMGIKPKGLNRGKIGVGGLIFYDKAGSGDLSNTSIFGTGSYMISVGPVRDHHLSFGLQIGLVTKTIDYTLLFFEDQFDVNGVGPGQPGFTKTTADEQGESMSYIDVNLGANWSHRFTDKIVGNGGMALFHINGPKETLAGDIENKLNSRFVLHLGATYMINEKISLEPGFRFMSQAKDQEINLGSLVTYKMGEAGPTDITLLGGLWTRMSMGNKNTDALYPMVGARYKQWQGGLSWDINVSSLQQASSGINGAPEIAIIYIGNLPKPSFVKPVIPCTRF
jgi:type IX secretion system PorP/SprF family membrane protein